MEADSELLKGCWIQRKEHTQITVRTQIIHTPSRIWPNKTVNVSSCLCLVDMPGKYVMSTKRRDYQTRGEECRGDRSLRPYFDEASEDAARTGRIVKKPVTRKPIVFHDLTPHGSQGPPFRGTRRDRGKPLPLDRPPVSESVRPTGHRAVQVEPHEAWLR